MIVSSVPRCVRYHASTTPTVILTLRRTWFAHIDFNSSFLAAGNSILDLLAHLTHSLLNLVPSVVHVCQSLLVLSVLRHVAELCEGYSTSAENTDTCEKVLCLHFEVRLR